MTAATAPEGLHDVLQRLDRVLAGACAAARTSYGPAAAADPFRGLHISVDDVDRLLRQPVGAANGYAKGAGAANGGARRSGWSDRFGRRSAVPTVGEAVPAADDAPTVSPHDAPEAWFGMVGDQDLAGAHLHLQWLAQAFGLSTFDLNLMVIALAPELDLRYERLYAYLQDDVTRRRPTVDLALKLLCAGDEERWFRRAHFGPEAPLVRHHLIALAGDPNDNAPPPLLGQSVQLDARIVDFVIGHEGPDTQLQGVLRQVMPQTSWADCPLPAEDIDRTRRLVAHHQARLRAGEPETLVLMLHGPDGAGKRSLAEAICASTEDGLLFVDIAALLRSELPPDEAVGRVFREAVLSQAPLYWSGFDLLLAGDERAGRFRDAVVAGLDTIAGINFLAGRSEWTPADAVRDATTIGIEVPTPPYAARDRLWAAELATVDGDLPGTIDRHSLANQFRFGPARIRDAVATARGRALWRDPERPEITQADLLAACRAHSNQRLGAAAQRVRPVYAWDDIVLPADQLSQLREICHAVRYQPTVLATWGFDRKLARGKGVNALFAGPSGTGKTMAAEIIAGELGLDLYKIDLASVVSKYIGETEKNLERIFGEAQTSNAILFFDEADALFGKRSEVKDAHDRYANIEIAYLLQRMEEFEGIVILATNLKNNLDDAFTRRIQHIVDFPFPEEADRLSIWQRVWPEEMPRDGDLDLAFMARQFRISGGHIKNIALATAYLAAADGGELSMRHVIRATRRELRKIGKLCPLSEFGPYQEWART